MVADPSFQIETTVDGSAHSIAVRGELDSATAPRLARAVEQAIGAAVQELRLDMSAVSFIDSAGIRTMISIEQSARERGVTLEVAAPPQELTELLHRAGLAGRLALTPSGHAPASREFLEKVEFELPAAPLAPGRARAELRDLLRDRVGEAELATAILLASELVTNAVLHPSAKDGSILVRATMFENGIRIEVADSGDGFDPAKLAERDTAGAVAEGGRGLFLVDRCASRWGTQRQPDALHMPFVVWFELDAAGRPGDAERMSVAC